MNIRTRWGAFWQGFRDGRESPDGLSSGITWDEPELGHLNEWYDHGVNWGQRSRFRRAV